jgi:GNAT superfamily N-acetyltransferase
MKIQELLEAVNPAQRAAIAIAKKKKKQGVAEEKQRLDAKCWDGYKKQGTKMKGDTRVNNCVPESIEQGVAEGLENFNGIDIDMDIEGDEIMVRAMAGGKELGHVLFVDEGEYLMPQDLEVDERYHGQGIAATMYNYVKSKGYKIRRSGQQTDAGTGFWNKHKPGKNVWEQGVAEGLDANQKKAKQVPSTEMPKKTSTVLGQAPKQHPFKGRAVGGGL